MQFLSRGDHMVYVYNLVCLCGAVWWGIDNPQSSYEYTVRC